MARAARSQIHPDRSSRDRPASGAAEKAGHQLPEGLLAGSQVIASFHCRPGPHERLSTYGWVSGWKRPPTNHRTHNQAKTGWSRTFIIRKVCAGARRTDHPARPSRIPDTGGDDTFLEHRQIFTPCPGLVSWFHGWRISGPTQPGWRQSGPLMVSVHGESFWDSTSPKSRRKKWSRDQVQAGDGLISIHAFSIHTAGRKET